MLTSKRDDAATSLGWWRRSPSTVASQVACGGTETISVSASLWVHRPQGGGACSSLEQERPRRAEQSNVVVDI